MGWARWLWTELTRPRGPVRHRFYRAGRSSRAGVALLMVITAIMLLTVLVTEIAHGAVVRVQLSAQHRDEVKAEMLALSGVSFYRLVLMTSKAIGKNPAIQGFAQMMGSNANELWQALPFIDTGFMRLLFVSNGSVDDGDVADTVAQGGLSQEQVDESREGSSLLNRNFLDFDGDFHASVFDEDRRIYVGNFQAQTLADLLATPTGQTLYAMFSREEFQDYLYDHNLQKEELLGNLADWTDPDDTRLFQGGSEDALYDRLDSPYRSKNAPFDTRDEVRLVDGWHLDGVWERVGENLTIYGDGKVNVNTATRPVLYALLLAYGDGITNQNQVEPFLAELMRLRGAPMTEGGVYFSSPQMFYNFVTTTLGFPLREDVVQGIKTESTVFRIHSAGEVGTARVEMIAVVDFSQDPTGRILHWRTR
jgi:general secretion pathway protein K